MNTTQAPKQPHFHLSFDQVCDSALLSAERMAEVEAEIERRISIPQDSQGRPIETARLADLSPWPRHLYPRMDHEPIWEYMRREILAVVLTEAERKMLDKYGLSAAGRRKNCERWERATKIPGDQWKGFVTDGETYWCSVGVFRLEEYGGDDDPGRTWPIILWAAIPERVITGRDVADVFESQMCDRGWEDMDVNDLNGVEALQAALDAFVEANSTVVSYKPDYTRAIIVEPQPVTT